MSEHNPPLGLLSCLDNRGPDGPPIGFAVEATCQEGTSSTASGSKHPRTANPEDTNDSKFRLDGTKEGGGDPFGMDNTYNDDSVCLLNPKVDHEQEVVKYLMDVARTVIAAGDTTLGFGILKVARDCLNATTAHLAPEQANLEALGHT